MTIQGGAARAVGAAEEVPEELLNYVVAQYPEYPESAHAVWREVLSRNEALRSQQAKWIHPGYLEGMRALDLPPRVPRVEEINERLAPTGWRTVCVDGYIPSAAYVGLMARHIFPIARFIRRAEHIDYAPAPDMVHDIIGHLPMLFLREHREYLQRVASVMVRAVANDLDAEYYAANRRMSELKSDLGSSPEEIARAEQDVLRLQRELQSSASELTHLSRLYLWSVEFGVIGDPESFWIHGAALLSAPTEVRAICDRAAPMLPYSMDVVKKDIAFSDLQSQYFVARDFEHLHEVLAEYETTMERREPVVRTSHIREISQKREGHA